MACTSVSIVLDFNSIHIFLYICLIHLYTHKNTHNLSIYLSVPSLIYSLCLFLYDQCLFYVRLGGIYGNIGMGAGGNTFFPGNIANLLTQSKLLLLLLLFSPIFVFFPKLIEIYDCLCFFF